jgi:hypothetical protein
MLKELKVEKRSSFYHSVCKEKKNTKTFSVAEEVVNYSRILGFRGGWVFET